jgi:hypothetical protein
MGLDVFAHSTSDKPDESVDFDMPLRNEVFRCWRKHPDFHGWMERLYRYKGGKSCDFKDVNLVLDAGDLDRLEAAIRSQGLPETDGCFIGESDGSEFEDDLRFIGEARERLARGLTVFYSSSW